MQPSTKLQLGFWRDVAIVLFTVLGFWVEVLHAEHLGVDVSPVVLTLFCAAILGVQIWIARRNLRDAVRAASLSSQIITIKDECRTQLEGLRSKCEQEKKDIKLSLFEKFKAEHESSQKYEMLLHEAQEQIRILTWKLEASEQAVLFRCLSGEALRLQQRLIDTLGQGNQLSIIMAQPLSDPMDKLPTDDSTAEKWLFQRQFCGLRTRVSFAFPQDKQIDIRPCSVPNELSATDVQELLERTRVCLSNYAASLFDAPSAKATIS